MPAWRVLRISWLPECFRVSVRTGFISCHPRASRRHTFSHLLSSGLLGLLGDFSCPQIPFGNSVVIIAPPHPMNWAEKKRFRVIACCLIKKQGRVSPEFHFFFNVWNQAFVFLLLYFMLFNYKKKTNSLLKFKPYRNVGNGKGNFPNHHPLISFSPEEIPECFMSFHKFLMHIQIHMHLHVYPFFFLTHLYNPFLKLPFSANLS